MQRSMNRRGFLKVAGLMTTAAFLAACQPTTTTTPEPDDVETAVEEAAEAPPRAGTQTTVEIQTGWYASGEPGNDFWQQVIAAFHEKPENEDLRVDLINVGTNAQDMLAAIAGGTAPDIYHTYGGGTGSFDPADMAPRGVAIALDDYIATSTYFEKDWYLPVYWEAKMWDGKVWALPCTEGGPGGTATTIHTRMLEEAGLPARGPETWDEYVDWAIQLTTYDDAGNLDVAGSDPLDSVGFSWPFWARHFDTSAISEDQTQITFDNDNWVRALNVIATVWQELGVAEMEAHTLAWDYWTGGMNSGFANGKRGIIFNGYWQPGEFTTTLADQDWDIIFDWPPSINIGEKVAAIGGTHSLWLTSNSSEPEQAFRFMDYMLSTEANLINYNLRGGFVWNTELDKVLDVGKYEGLDWFMAVPNTADRIISPLETQSPIGAEITAGFNRMKEEVIYGQKSAEQALADITVELQQSLDEALAR